jgi:UDP-glucose 4-epimerase
MAEIWITGARGFIGRHLARECASRGHRVHGIGHGSWLDAERNAWGITGWLNSEVTSAGLDVLASQQGSPDVLFHLAGGSSVGASVAAPREDFARTVVATAELVEWLRTRAPATRVVAASSAAVYGDGWDAPIPVTAAVRPCSPYGAHKAAMETMLAGHARSFGLRFAIVRLFSVYGPGLEKQLLWDLCTRLAAGHAQITLGGTGDEVRDFVYIADAARLLANAAESAGVDCPVFNGGRGVAVSVRRLAEALICAWPARVTLGFSGESRSGDPRRLVAEVAACGAIAPPQWVDLESGLALTVAAARARLGVRGPVPA